MNTRKLASDLLRWADGGDALQVVGSAMYAATMRGEAAEIGMREMLDAVDLLRHMRDNVRYPEAFSDYDAYETGELADRLYAYAMGEEVT